MTATPDRLRAFAKAMRRAPVVSERSLWRLLRDRRLDSLKFRRQVPVGRYVADFLCLRHRLIVEADGPTHEESPRDLERDAWLRAQGFRILRFPNTQIENRPHQVLATIIAATTKSPTPLVPVPSPLAGEGVAAGDG